MNKRLLVILILLVASMFTFQAIRGARRSSASMKAASSVTKQTQHADASPKSDPPVAETPIIHASFRPLNFALLRGGFSSVNEFFDRVHDDPVLHAFYGDCADRNASMHALPEDITAFSTFRKGNKIAWAARPLLVKKGEYVMTFCGKTVLARCGNLISASPMTPSEDIPPALLEAPSEPAEPPIKLAAVAPPATGEPANPATVAAAVPAHHGFFFIPPFYIPQGGGHSTPPPTGFTPPPPPPAPPGHISGDEFSGHQAFITLFIGLFVIGVLKLTTR
jgi:hypothetical protein